MIQFNPTNTRRYIEVNSLGDMILCYMDTKENSIVPTSLYKYSEGVATLANLSITIQGQYFMAMKCSPSADHICLISRSEDTYYGRTTTYFEWFVRSGDSYNRAGGWSTTSNWEGFISLPYDTSLVIPYTASIQGIMMSHYYAGNNNRFRPRIQLFTRSGNSYTASTLLDMQALCSLPNCPETLSQASCFSSDSNATYLLYHAQSSAYNSGLRILKRSGNTYTQIANIAMPTNFRVTYIHPHPTNTSLYILSLYENSSPYGKKVALLTASGDTFTLRNMVDNNVDLSALAWMRNADRGLMRRGATGQPAFTAFEVVNNILSILDITEEAPLNLVQGVTKFFDNDLALAFTVYTPTTNYFPSGYYPGLSIIHPNGNYLNPNTEARLSWDYSSGFKAFVPAGNTLASQVSYRLQGDATSTTVNIGPNIFVYDIPIGGLTALKNYEWQVRIQKEDSTWSSWTAWAPFTTTDGTAIATPASPKDTYVDLSIDTVFSWHYENSTGAPASRTVIEYNVNNGPIQVLATETTGVTQVIIPGGTISSGTVSWRTQAFNQDSVAGPWSSWVSFIGIGAPAKPVIASVTNSNYPIVSWNAPNQLGYRVKIFNNTGVLYDSGAVFSTDKSQQSDVFIPNGEYTVAVSVLGDYELWSADATTSAIINVPAVDPPILSAEAINPGSVMLYIADPPPGSTSFKVYRNGTFIGELPFGELVYIDNQAAQISTYYVMAVMNGGENMVRSNSVTITTNIEGAFIGAADGTGEKTKLCKLPEGQPIDTMSAAPSVTLQSYAGRRLPVAYFGGEENRAHNFTFYDTNSLVPDAVQDLYEQFKTVLYRDQKNTFFYGVITGFNKTTQHNVIVFTLTIQEVDYVQGAVAGGQI